MSSLMRRSASACSSGVSRGEIWGGEGKYDYCGSQAGHLESQRQPEAERRAAAYLRFKVYRTVVELHNEKGAGEPNSATPGPRGEEKLEDAGPVLGSNAVARIGYTHLRHLATAGQG